MSIATPPGFRVGASRINGRGLYAERAIERRRKLGELSGELVRLPQAWRTVADRERIYLVELDPRWALDCRQGNAFRFLNHSCAANCYLRVFRHHVEVYARGPIAKGSELTVDYGATPHRHGMVCRCGAPNCRGRL